MYADLDDAIRRHCKNTQTYTGETPGQVRSIRIIPESDVNRLMMRSNKEEALVFQDWLGKLGISVAVRASLFKYHFHLAPD